MIYGTEVTYQKYGKKPVMPIPKPFKDNTNAKNYRPIYLRSRIFKTLERMVNARLIWYLETNKLITEYQSGFRNQRSPIDHLIRLETFIREASIKKEHLVGRGVPQGRVLSVMLFNIKINNIVKNINSRTNCTLYVDDFLICYRARNMNHIERQLQMCLDKLHKWTTENGLKFLKEKRNASTSATNVSST